MAEPHTAPQLHIAQDPVADELLSTDAFALLTGMLLDQQFPMERAFAGPAKIKERFGTLDPEAIAAADPEAFADLCATPPAVHRYGRSMAGRVQALAAAVVADYDGDAANIWTRARDGRDLFARVHALPGFKSQIPFAAWCVLNVMVWPMRAQPAPLSVGVPDAPGDAAP